MQRRVKEIIGREKEKEGGREHSKNKELEGVLEGGGNDREEKGRRKEERRG